MEVINEITNERDYSKRIVLNALGTKFEVTGEILQKSKEGSRLYDLKQYKKLTDDELSIICDDFDRVNQEFFFNRDPNVLKKILIYLINGELHMNSNMCPVHFAKELEYWKIDQRLMHKCCLHTFEDTYDEKIKKIEEEEELIKKCKEELMKTPTLKEKLWNIVEHPKSSKIALAYFLITNLLLLLWFIYFVYGTFPDVRDIIEGHQLTNQSAEDKENTDKYNEAFLIIDCTLFTYFLIDLLFRFFTCPSMVKFFQNVLNLIDAFSIVLFFILFFISLSVNYEPVHFSRRCIESLRVILFLKFTKLSWRFRTIGKALRESVTELLSGMICILICMLIISTAIFYVEVSHNPSFHSIPAAFWWTIITMTTVGYGDVVPLSTLGKCFAGMTVILGIGLLAIPIGIIGSNFSVIYFAEEKKEKFIKKIEKSLKQERKIDKF